MIRNSNNLLTFSVSCAYSSLNKLRNPSAERNQGPILEVLHRLLSRSGEKKLLEVSSGTGQHASIIGQQFTNIKIQPSEYEKRNFASIRAYAQDCMAQNVYPPIYIDISEEFPKWDENRKTYNDYYFNDPTKKSISHYFNDLDYMLNINMIHIAPFACTIGLFRTAGSLLKNNGLLITYGPVAVDGNLTPESNVAFDKHLRSENPEWGVRDTKELKEIAGNFGITLDQMFDMPANNKILSWKKD